MNRKQLREFSEGRRAESFSIYGFTGREMHYDS